MSAGAVVSSVVVLSVVGVVVVRGCPSIGSHRSRVALVTSLLGVALCSLLCLLPRSLPPVGLTLLLRGIILSGGARPLPLLAIARTRSVSCRRSLRGRRIFHRRGGQRKSRWLGFAPLLQRLVCCLHVGAKFAEEEEGADRL